MKTFKTKIGEKEVAWEVAVNVGSAKRVRDLAGVDLLKIVDGGQEVVTRLMGDVELLVNVIYVLCKPQADAAGVSDEQFGASLVGDAIDDATAALLEDLIGFFPKAPRTLMSKALQKTRAVQSLAVEIGVDKLDKMDVEKELRGLIAGDSALSVPGSPESTPKASPSAS